MKPQGVDASDEVKFKPTQMYYDLRCVDGICFFQKGEMVAAVSPETHTGYYT